ncbi:hypothetical protein MCOR02_006302 [Pyricularia oryzae]|nr:hypothetical protein MCOR02_006302 [Pyricularia oryzae]KAI6316272.1 hypothetical protein MCOR34_004410 [Pyricularia oryzae]KAI6473781.1 hypothetical protein MCOR17_002465 [Pyricularia oryzae]KAI6505644.1 hypothetical protein MCOR13_004001 [Pyricularia oryzae]KAI6604178.1 hypothetical protein MCOR04_001553 [Pyricularia oryzae]
MSAPDPDLPIDTIVVGGDSYTHSEDESMVEDDGLNDIYSDDGDQQAQNGEHATVDAAPGDKLNQEHVDDDDYANSFDSPNAEHDATLEDQGETSVSEQLQLNNATSNDTSASNSAPAESTAVDTVNEIENKTAPANSVESGHLTSPRTPAMASVGPSAEPPAQPAPESVVESEDTAKPVVSTSQQLQGSHQQEQEEQPQPDLSQVVATLPDTDVSGSEALSATVPKNAHYSHDDAANDANLAFDIQELVKDIKAASSPSPSASSGSSSESDSSGEMQIDAESPPPPESSTSLETSVPVSLVNVPTESTSSVGGPESATLTELASIPLMPNASLPAPVQGRAQSSKKANGGKKGKKESQVPSNAPSAPANARAPPSGPKGQGQNNNRQGNNQRSVTQTYEGFVNDERRYTAEAKWEKFPEGSRIFVGNLSQDRATKKEVFNIFHPYGRLAQISLKSAYGFVQYHAASEAAEAIKHLQGVDVRGRKLNLEVSKTQKRNGKERERSPDRNDKNKKRKSDSFDGGRELGRNTDGYRPSYDQPRRGDRHGEDSRGRYGDRGRSRSRSPRPYSRNEDHRQRSPLRGSYSDQRGHDSSRDPQPHAIAPDSQILLLEDVNRDFVQYVKKAFTDVGLTTDVMFVDVRAMDNVQQRLIMQGAHASVQLDMRAQTIGKVTMRVFKRTPGVSHVSYDEYRDLDVNIAASLVLQTKNMSRSQQAPPPPVYPPHAASGYPHAYPAPAYGAPAHTMPAQQPVMPGALGQVDPAILQRVLMQLNGGQPQAHAAPTAYGALPHVPVMAPAPAAPAPATTSQIDINAILNNLRSAGANSVPAPGPGPAAYGTAAPYPGPNPISPVTGGPGTAPHAGAANTNQHVQNIMAQLSRFRQ